MVAVCQGKKQHCNNVVFLSDSGIFYVFDICIAVALPTFSHTLNPYEDFKLIPEAGGLFV